MKTETWFKNVLDCYQKYNTKLWRKNIFLDIFQLSEYKWHMTKKKSWNLKIKSKLLVITFRTGMKNEGTIFPYNVSNYRNIKILEIRIKIQNLTWNCSWLLPVGLNHWIIRYMMTHSDHKNTWSCSWILPGAYTKNCEVATICSTI